MRVLERSVKQGTCAKTLSPALDRHYLTQASDVHYAMRPGQEGDVEKKMNFEDIHSIEDLAVVSEEVVWQHFERLAAFIFEKNNFSVTVNTVKTYQKTKRQYDVIAWKGNQTFLVECKKWAGNRYRLSAVKKAVEQHKERTRFYAAITNEDAIPLLVTLIEEEIRVYEGVPIVCIQKLNGFVNELDGYVQGDFFCECVDDIPNEDDIPLPDEVPLQSY